MGCGDALFLNEAGRIACAGTGNLFLLRGAELATPPSSEGVLDGVARGVLLGLAGEIGLDPVERPMAIAELEAADAVLATNSLRLLAPVTAIGARTRSIDPRVTSLSVLMAAAVSSDVGIDPRDGAIVGTGRSAGTSGKP